MDCDPYKIGCANGILHLRTIVYDKTGNEVGYRAELRPRTPEDHVSFQAGVSNRAFEPIEYEPYDPIHPDAAELIRFFEMIFPNRELRECVLTLAAGCLEGNNIEQLFYIMTGSGSNGKSKFINLMEYTLGDYTSSLSPTILTRKRPIENEQAVLTHLKNTINRRFISISEPDQGEQLNTAIIKQLSGGDNVMVRGLYKEQEQIKVSGKMFLATNRMPHIESMEGGTWRRIKVIPFLSKFLDPGHPSIDPANNCYEKDPDLDHKLIKWRKAFFSLLVYYYETKYCVNHGIRKFPSMVDEYMNEYIRNNDTFEKFMQERIRMVTSRDTRASGSHATLKDIFAVFNAWAEAIPTKKISERELKERLCELLGKPADAKKNIFMRIKLFRSDEELEEWEREGQ
jgi:P4 family phage/plasmid primase-like protien